VRAVIIRAKGTMMYNSDQITDNDDDCPYCGGTGVVERDDYVSGSAIDIKEVPCPECCDDSIPADFE
jgi:hypothetical protein